MNKKDFLNELKKYLEILDENEQRDILDEYTQHIDMKMSRGMSEEEAIRDFGDINQLASDILEAYHVNPRFEPPKKQNFEKVKEESMRVCSTAGGFLKKAWSGTKGFFRKSFNAGIEGMRFCGRIAVKPVKALRELLTKLLNTNKLKGNKIGCEMSVSGENKGKVKGIFIKMANIIKNAFNGCIKFVLWCIKWAWNIMMFLAGAMAGMFAMMFLFAFGVIAVLLAAGYPMIGLTLALLGLVLCAGSAAVILFSFIKTGNKKHYDEEEVYILQQEVTENA